MEVVRVIAAIVIVVLVLTLLGALILRIFRVNLGGRLSVSPTPGATTAPVNPTAGPTPTSASEPTIGQPVATYREFAGDSVVIPYVNLPSPGFVAIHSLNDQFQLDRVITHSVFMSETDQRQVQLYLPDRTFSHRPLAIVLHRDDGDQIFEYPGPDVPFEEDDSQPLVYRLDYIPNAPLTPTP